MAENVRQTDSSPSAESTASELATPDLVLGRKSTWLHIGTIGVSLALLGVSRLIFNVVGQHVFGLQLVGKANVLLSLAMLVGLPSSAGIAMAISRFVPICSNSKELGDTVRASVLLALITSIIVIVPAAAVSRVLREPAHGYFDLAIGALWATLYAVYAVGRSLLFAKTRIRLVLTLELLGFASFGAALLLATRWHALWWTPFAVYPIPVTVSVLRAYHPHRTTSLPKAGFVRFAALAFLGSVAGQGVQYGSTLVSGATGGALLAGTWATLVSLASPVLLLPRSLSTSFLPRLSGLSVVSRDRFEAASKEHQSLSALLALPATTVLLIAGLINPPWMFPSDRGVDIHVPWLLLCCLTYVTSRSEPIMTGNASLGFAGPNAVAAGLAAPICGLTWWLMPGTTTALVAIAAGLLLYALVVPVLAMIIVRWKAPPLRPKLCLQPGDIAMAAGLAVLLCFPATFQARSTALVISALGFAAQCWAFSTRHTPGRMFR